MLPQLTPNGVMRETLDLLAGSIVVKRLDGSDDPCVKLTAALMQEASVGDLVGERMLERVLGVREELGLVEELGGLKVCETFPERIVGCVGNGCEEGERDVFADHGCGLKEPFVVRLQAVDTGRENRLRRRWNLQAIGRSGQAIGSGVARQDVRLDERAHALLEKGIQHPIPL